MKFEDRISAYPGRYLLTDARSGDTSYVLLERADEPVKVGTPLNAETFNAMFASFVHGIESSTYPGCHYRLVAGDELEWINPPMVKDVEYRTIERHNGLPVYMKRVVLTSIPSTVDVCSADYKAVGVSAVMYSDVDGGLVENIPLVRNGKVEVWVNVNGLNNSLMPETHKNLQIQLSCSDGTSFGSGYTAECVVKYVKE